MNPDYLLNRYKQNDFATYGHLILPSTSQVLYYTIERPWVEDPSNPGHRHPDTSCLVADLYRLIRAHSPKRGYPVWWWCGVPDVSSAEDETGDKEATTAQIHIANLPDELEGCVGIGTLEGWIQRKTDPKPLPGIVRSGDAFQSWMDRTASATELWIQIIEVF